ncbi:hypothetical protein IV203_008258 [Nitzschia inconspicua]|uniref:Uncharacterized protein n=1 Tax=Nitzschia inconspicua TaxID=303405 RepID=A0A9K3PLS9_9STRA|nr:hypothetical protein IV203_008258 [Nitzschia inconspicua]
MWLTSRKPHAKPSTATSTANSLQQQDDENSSSRDIVSDSSLIPKAKKDDWESSLPLDWTRMGKKRKRKEEDDDEDCNHPSNCSCRRRHLRPANAAASTVLNATNISSTQLRVNRTKLHGQAIFCLHELDPQWVQGYFVPIGSTKPWGLLAVQEEIDDCLACADGGYRRVSLTVYPPATKSTASTTSRSRQRTVTNMDWTCGDMMTLYHPDHGEMTAEQLVTGHKALPLLHKYFQGLLDRLQPREEPPISKKENTSVLDWLPDVAVVKGSMTLILPEES